MAHSAVLASAPPPYLAGTTGASPVVQGSYNHMPCTVPCACTTSLTGLLLHGLGGISAACQTLILDTAEQVVRVTLRHCLPLLAVLQTWLLMMQGSDEVVEMNKSIRLKMFLPSQRLHVVYPHQRSQEFFTSTPGQAGLPHVFVLGATGALCCTAQLKSLALASALALITRGWSQLAGLCLCGPLGVLSAVVPCTKPKAAGCQLQHGRLLCCNLLNAPCACFSSALSALQLSSTHPCRWVQRAARGAVSFVRIVRTVPSPSGTPRAGSNPRGSVSRSNSVTSLGEAAGSNPRGGISPSNSTTSFK